MKKIFLLFIFSTAIAINSFSQAHSSDDDRGYIVNVGDSLPDFTLTLINGETISNKDLKGKVVMLQFTASWCIVCKQEMPHIESEIQQLYKDRKDFVLIGIDRDEPIEKVKAFATEMKITYPLALDPGAAVFQKFALKEAGVTRNIIINKEGKIIYLTRLYNPEEFETMKKIIANEFTM